MNPPEPVFDCEECLANQRSPRCKRRDCADQAAELRRLRAVLLAGGGEPHVAAAFLARAEHAEQRADELGTRLALAERALRRLLAKQPAGSEIEAWKQAVKEHAA